MRAFAMAILAHVLLAMALTWGINWKRESRELAVEAELWASVPQQAAPALVQPPPSPEAPPPQAVAPPPPTPVAQPDIVLEQDKRKAEQAQRLRQELERQKQREARLKAQALEKLKKQNALKKEETLQRERVADEKAADARKRSEAQAKAARDKAKREQAEAEQLEAQRQENLKRMQGLAGASGSSGSTGTALQTSGPSSSYGGRIRAKVRPNIVFTETISGNPTAEVDVRMAPDGTIVSRKLVKSSGLPAWDEAVLRALDRTEVLPRDTDGRVPSSLLLSFRPKD